MGEAVGQVEAAPRYRVVGDGGLLVEFAPVIAPEVNRRVRALLAALDAEPPPGILDLVPAYRSLLVCYDPVVLGHAALLERLRALEPALAQAAPASRIVTVPVAYGGDFGPDLAGVAAHTGLSPDEVIARHAAGTYTVYFLGFTPGFPYLGGLDPALATPRLSQPRTAVPAGAVGIGGAQTGIYSLPAPGGWRLLGQTPVRLYDPAAEPPFLLRAGDELRFRAIAADEYARLDEAIAAGRYEPEIVAGEGGA
jgi:inhibitor of KinA